MTRRTLELACSLILSSLILATSPAPLLAQQAAERIVVRTSGGAVSIERGVSGALPEQVGRLVQRRVEGFALAPRRVPLIVAFDAPLTDDRRRELAEDGLVVINRLSDNSYTVFASPDAAAGLAGVAGVTGAALVPPAAKIDPEARRPAPLAWESRDGGRRAYSVLFYPGVRAEEIAALGARFANLAFEDLDPGTIEIVRVVTVVLAPEELARLAEEPIVQRIEPVPPPVIPYNLLNTQPLSNVDDVQVAPYNLSGTGISIGVWEATELAGGFGIRNTHEDLTPRVTVAEASTFSDHGTHVAGTIASSGANTANAEGMAPAATLSSYGAAGDSGEMTAAANSAGGSSDPVPIVASNHSYGAGNGWNGQGTQFSSSQNNFGRYTNTSVAFDNVVVNTDLVVMQAAGNDRNDTWNGTSTDPSIPTPTPPRDCTQNGLGVDADCLSARGVAKNVITVGAMNDSATAIAAFSNFGPTDDGRIKPDLMANGTNVLSLGKDSDSDSYTTQGTSMASPAVTGMVALLLEEAGNQGLALSAAAVKALLIQTAQDVATAPANTGPDYASGWGIANVQAAVDLMRLPGGPGLAQETLTGSGAAGAYTQAFLVPAGLAELHATLVWTDPAGTAGAPFNQAKLVNDLDLRLIRPDGTTVTPWSLNPAQPGNAAVRSGGDDAVNNVEQVSELNPVAGVWQVQVSAKATSFAGPQDFAVAGPLTPASGPFASDPADVMLVMDRSGSMSLPSATPGVSKIEALRSAAEEVANFLEIVGGHQLGLVRFNTSGGATSPAFGLQPLDSASIGTAESAIANLNASGGTNIIDGVQLAVNELAGPAAANTRQAIVLFTDGRHNTPTGSDVNDIDAIMDAATDFYSIGFGTDVDSTVLPGVAANHDGVHLEEQNLTSAELSKLLLTVAGIAIDATVVVDPDYTVTPGGVAHQRIVATTADRAITFAVHWNEPNAEQFAFRVRGPNAYCRIPDKAHSRYQVRGGKRYRLIRITLPYTCGHSGAQLHAGEWTLELKSHGDATDTAKVVVLAESALAMNLVAVPKEGTLIVQASLLDGGKPLVGAARMRATITPNRKSTGDSEREDRAGGKGSVGVKPGQIGAVRPPYSVAVRRGIVSQRIARNVDPNKLRRLSVLRAAMPKSGYITRDVKVVELRDDGAGGDELALDGIYTARVAVQRGTLYQVRAIAELPGRTGTVSREALGSAFVR